MSKPRVLIADDHTLVTDAIGVLLAPVCEIIGRVTDGRALLVAAREQSPDMVIVDVGMPLLNGLDAGRQIHQFDTSIKLIYITMNEDPEIAAEAFRAGASAYILKRSAGSELVNAVHEVMKRRSYLTPLVTEGLVHSLTRGLEDRPQAHELTPRQREVLQLLAEGKSMKEAASILSVAARTIAFHKYRVMEQLGIKTSAELIRFAVAHHLV